MAGPPSVCFLAARSALDMRKNPAAISGLCSLTHATAAAALWVNDIGIGFEQKRRSLLCFSCSQDGITIQIQP